MEDDSCGLICKDFFLYHWRGLIIFFTPLILLPIPILMNCVESNLLYVVTIMIVYWAFELIPPGITGCIPIVLFPVLGILDSNKTCQNFMSNALFVFLGGLIIALAFEHSNLHKRFALNILSIFGPKPPSLLLGLMIYSIMFSSILNNVAVTTLMCPIVAAIMSELESQGISMHFREPGPDDVENKYAKKEDAVPVKYPTSVTIGMYLGVAYAATVGGTLTLFGTVTNLAFSQLARNISNMNQKSADFDQEHFDKSNKYITLVSIFLFNIIMMLIEAFIIYLWLSILHLGLLKSGGNKPYAIKDEAKAEIKQKLKDLGSMSSHEIQVIIAFFIMVVILVTRELTYDLGWGMYANNRIILDSCVIVMVVIFMFMFPTHYRSLKFCFGKAPFTTKPTPSLVSWKMVHNFMPWGTLLLLGGAFAVGRAIEVTMQSKSFVNKYSDFFGNLSPSMLIILTILIATGLTQICSNVATANIMIYFLRDLAELQHLSPADLFVPVSVACSIAFIFPVSTPPNAIVYHYGHIKTSKMFVSGIIPTIALLLLLIVFSLIWYGFIFGAVESIPPPTTTTTTPAPPPPAEV